MKFVAFVRARFGALMMLFALALGLAAPASAQTGGTTAYSTLITAMITEVTDFQNNFAIPATVALLGLIAVLTAIRWVRGMFRSAA